MTLEEKLAKLDSDVESFLVTERQLRAHKIEREEAYIATPTELLPDLLKHQAQGQGPTLPWPKTHRYIRLPGGELSVWAGLDGCRKSLITQQVALHLTTQGQTFSVASLEVPPIETLRRALIQSSCCLAPTKEIIERAVKYLENKMYIYTNQDLVDPDTILNFADYSAAKLKTDHIIIDSLMMIDIAPDDFMAQKKFIVSLASIAKKYGVHVHLVCHFTKLNQSHKPNRSNIAGNKALTNAASNVFLISMNEQKAEEKHKPLDQQDQEIMSKPEMFLTPDKQRFRPRCRAFALEFDDKSLQTIENKRYEYFNEFE